MASKGVVLRIFHPAGASKLILPLLLLPCILAPSAMAQTVAREVSEAAAVSNLGRDFQTIALVGQTPGVSRSTIDSGALELTAHRLHFGHVFKRKGAESETAAPYFEITVGRGKAQELFSSNTPVIGPLDIDFRFRSWSTLVGGGANVPVGRNTHIVPMLLLGRSSLKIDSTFRGPNAAIVGQQLVGLLDDARIQSTQAGGALELRHASMIFGSRFSLSTRYNHFFDLSNDVSDPGLKPRGDSGLATAAMRLETPTKVYFGERELLAGVFARGSLLTGAGRNRLGFNDIAEVGGTLVVDYPVDRGIGFGVFGSALRGGGVKGHSMGIILTFSGTPLLGHVD